MALKELPTSWNIDGVDWNAPDPFDVRVINAILLAIRERYSFRELYEKPYFLHNVPSLLSQFSPAIAGDIFNCFDNSFFEKFFTPESVFSGNRVFMTEKWITERFPLVFCEFPAGASTETYSQHLKQWYNFLNACRYVYYNYDRDYIIFKFSQGLDGHGESDYYPFSSPKEAYNSAVQNYDNEFSTGAVGVFYRQFRVSVYYKQFGADYGYTSYLHSSGCYGSCKIINNTFYNVNAVLRASMGGSHMYYPCGFPYTEGETFVLSAPKGETNCEEMSDIALVLPTYEDIQSMVSGDYGRFFVEFRASGIAADLSPSFRFFTDVSDQ